MTSQMIERKVYHLTTRSRHWGPTQALASGASTVVPADVSISDENTIIDDESGICSEDDGELWTWQLLAVQSVGCT